MSLPDRLPLRDRLAATRLAASLALGLALAAPAPALDGDLVESQLKITLPGEVDGFDRFGSGLAFAEDLGGSPVLFVGAERDDDGIQDAGAVYALFLAPDGTVASHVKISDTLANDPNDVLQLANGARFGAGLAVLPDLDGAGPGVLTLAVGAERDDTPVLNDTGAVWIVHLDATATPVGGHQLFASGLGDLDLFGRGVAYLGDWGANGGVVLGVGAPSDDDAGSNRGALYLLYLDAAGQIAHQYKIVHPTGVGTEFGWSVAAIGDRDGDGQVDLAVGQPQFGEIWRLQLDPGCTPVGASPPSCSVSDATPLSQLGFTAATSSSELGSDLAFLPGLPADRLLLSGIGSFSTSGEVWVVELGNDVVLGEERITSEENWSVVLDDGDQFGSALAVMRDFDGDGAKSFAVGHWLEDGVASNEGAVWSIAPTPCAEIVVRPMVFHDPDDDGLDRPCDPVPLPAGSPVELDLYLETGSALSPGTTCQEGQGGGNEVCAYDVRIVLEGGLTLQSLVLDPALSGADFHGPLGGTELRINWIGPAVSGVVRLADVSLNQDPAQQGVVRIDPKSAAVGAALELLAIPARPIALPEPGMGAGMLAGLGLLGWLARRRRAAAGGRLLALLLSLPLVSHAQGISVKGQIRLSEGENGIPEDILSSSAGLEGLGFSVVSLGDQGNDGTIDLAAGCCHIGGGNNEAKVLTLELDTDGSVAEAKIGLGAEDAGTGTYSSFGSGLANLGDRDGDGHADLLVGGQGLTLGADRVSLVFLDRDLREKSGSRIVIDKDGGAGFPAGLITGGNMFGASVAALGNADGDPGGTYEIAVGEPSDDDNSVNGDGSVWILSLDDANQVVAYQKLSQVDLAGVTLDLDGRFGSSLASIGDLDGNGTPDLAVGAELFGDNDGAVFVLFLAPGGASCEPAPPDCTSILQVIGHQRIGYDPVSGLLVGGLTLGGADLFLFGKSLGWLGDVTGEGGGVLAVGGREAPDYFGSVFMLHLAPDGTVRADYRIRSDEGGGATIEAAPSFADAIHAPGDLDGDEVPDLIVTATDHGDDPGAVPADGVLYVFFMQDSDHDGLDDRLDNCPFVHNPVQADVDDDGVGDLCDNCVDLANPTQDDLDTDGEGDVCEPVEIQLQTTGTPAAPSWNLLVQCGARDVTDLNGAIVLPDGYTGTPTLTLNGGSIGGGSTVSGPGLLSPSGVRGDAMYFEARGNGGAGNDQLCSALDLPVLLGTLTTGAIAGTQLAAAALTAEGVGNPGFLLNLAESTTGTVPLTDIRLVNGIPLPVLELELGPAVVTSGGTRWDVLLRNGLDEFHRVAFGLIAPAGTTTADMRWVGCEGTPSAGGERDCAAVTGFGTTANPASSWTIGPQASPSGTQLTDTLYVVLEGNRSPIFGNLTLNPFDGPQTVVLGTVELDGAPDLEPALTTDGVNDIAPRGGGSPITPFEESDAGTPDPSQVKLIGAFNPADDLDSDGIQDLGDNCPYQYNPPQQNRGSFLDAVDETDVFGDACQCGESTDDGAVLDPEDFELIRDYLTGKDVSPHDPAAIEARCSVAGTTECNIRDLVFLKQALDASALEVETRCDAALSPATGP